MCAHTVQCSLTILLAASDESVLVSRAVNITVKEILLKPAGKDTHKEKQRLVFRHCIIITLIFQLLSPTTTYIYIYIYTYTYSYVSYLYTYICNPIALMLCVSLYHLANTHTRTHRVPHYPSFVYFSPFCSDMYTQTHTHKPHVKLSAPL